MVKLDGSYVSGVAHNGRERGFVAGMVDIARAMEAAVVAERIETEADADALLAVGVTYGQGWLFGRPGPLPLPTTRRRMSDGAAGAPAYACADAPISCCAPSAR